MKKIIIVTILLLLFPLCSLGKNNDIPEYQELITILKTRQKIAESELKTISLRLKTSKNDSVINLEYNEKKYEIDKLKNDIKTVEKARKTREKMIDALNKYDSLKKETESMDKEVRDVIIDNGL